MCIRDSPYTWYIAFIPGRDVAVAVMVEGGPGVGLGSVGATVAGPIGRAVLKASIGESTPQVSTPTYQTYPTYQTTPTYQSPTYSAPAVTPENTPENTGGTSTQSPNDERGDGE